MPRPMAALASRRCRIWSRSIFTVTPTIRGTRTGDSPSSETARGTPNAGFGVAYVSDHKTIDGAKRALASNPSASAAAATILLPSIEQRDKYEHVNAIGFDTAIAYDLKATGTSRIAHATRYVESRAPFLLLTIPGNIDSLPRGRDRGYAACARSSSPTARRKE